MRRVGGLALLCIAIVPGCSDGLDLPQPFRPTVGDVTPLASPVPTLAAPGDATIVGVEGNEIGVQRSYCWSSGSTTRCLDLPPLSIEGDSLPVHRDETLTVQVEAQVAPASESFGLAKPEARITLRPIDPALESAARADVPPGLYVARLCGSWPQHGQVCWGFLLDVS